MADKKQFTYQQLTEQERELVDRTMPMLLGKSIDEPLFFYVKQGDESRRLTAINNRNIGQFGYGPMFCFACRQLFDEGKTCDCDQTQFATHHWPNTEQEAQNLLAEKSLREQFEQL